MDSNYQYHNIFGKLEYENYFGALKTDFTMLRPGLLHNANGGYIIFQAKDLLSNPVCYEALKKALRIKQLSIENNLEQRSAMIIVSLKPEPIPLDLKVILIGSSSIYQTLLAMDSDFRKLFKIKVEFEDDAPLNEENANKLASIIHGFCEAECLPHLDTGALGKLIEFASKLAQDYLLTRMSKTCALYINGAYRGLYNIREKITPGMISDHFNVDKTTVSISRWPGNLEAGEKITNIFSMNIDDKHPYITGVTRTGLIKKADKTIFIGATQNKNGLKAAGLNEGDTYLGFWETNGDYITLITNQNMAIQFMLDEVRRTGKTGKGVIGIKLTEGDFVSQVSITSQENKKVVLQRRAGKGKKYV